jgi:hypothetical protein
MSSKVKNQKSKRGLVLFALCFLVFDLSMRAAEPAGGHFNTGVDLYKAGRYSDAVEAFELAIRRKERAPEAQDYIDRIRKETVERIRNKALTGINKATWQNKYYFMNEVDHRIHVGISVQEVFERDSVNFRPGSVDALNQLAAAFAKAEAAQFDVELINELNGDTPPDPTLTAQQENAVFSYLSLASRGVLPKF